MTASSRFTIRVPRALHLLLLAEAQRRGVSLNALVTTLLQQAAELQASRSPEPPAPAKGSLLDSASADAGGPIARFALATRPESEC
jgi:hypothetical protein